MSPATPASPRRRSLVSDVWVLKLIQRKNFTDYYNFLVKQFSGEQSFEAHTNQNQNWNYSLEPSNSIFFCPPNDVHFFSGAILSPNKPKKIPLSPKNFSGLCSKQKLARHIFKAQTFFGLLWTLVWPGKLFWAIVSPFEHQQVCRQIFARKKV